MDCGRFLFGFKANIEEHERFSSRRGAAAAEEEDAARVTNGMVLALGGGAVSPETRPTTTVARGRRVDEVECGMERTGLEVVREEISWWNDGEDDKNVINCLAELGCRVKTSGMANENRSLRDFRF